MEADRVQAAAPKAQAWKRQAPPGTMIRASTMRSTTEIEEGTMPIPKFAKKTFFWIALFLGVSVFASDSRSGDFEQPHRLRPGDVISADVLNEIFEDIYETHKTVRVEDILGTWRGRAYGSFIPANLSNPTPWLYSPEGGYYYLDNVTVTFRDDGDGTYTLYTSDPSPFSTHSGGAPALLTSFELIGNTLFKGNVYKVHRISRDRLTLSLDTGGEAGNATRLLILDRDKSTPAPPGVLTVSQIGNMVRLSWSDESTNETSFQIMRKNEASMPFSKIAVVGPNVTSYDDPVPVSDPDPNDVWPYDGRLWYRVFAVNAEGESYGSTVAYIEVGN
jgi:hypothetical protein